MNTTAAVKSLVDEQLEEVSCASSAATPAWRIARNRCESHMGSCSTCHVPTAFYCAAGAGLLAAYHEEWTRAAQ